MTLKLRAIEAGDLPACAENFYQAFKSIAEAHRFPPDFPNAEVAGGMLGMMFEAPGFEALVAEEEDRAVGSIFVSLRSALGGISVITVHPEVQNRSVGRRLMEEGMALLTGQGHERQQLVQAAYHNRSLVLYAKLGFVAAEMLSNMTGPPVRAEIPGRIVRPASDGDAEACNALCHQVHGFDRAGEVAAAISQGMTAVVEHEGRISGYTTGVGFVGHGVGLANDDVKALIASADEFAGPGILIPTGNNELFTWCLGRGLRVVQQLTLMDTAPAGPAKGAWWPAVLC